MSLRLPSVRCDGDAAAGTLILHETAHEHHWKGTGAVSLKWFPRGEARYRVNGCDIRLDASRFLVIGPGEEYEISIDSNEETESLCVFFEEHLVGADAREWLTTSHSAESVIIPMLTRIQSDVRLKSYDRLELLERMHDLADAVRSLRDSGWRCEERLSARRPVTRREILRRVHRAKELIHYSHDRRVSLGDIAATAAMSTNHLLRNFRSVFGVSPHQYLLNVRLERARTMIRSGDHDILQIALTVGFETHSSFTHAYRRHFGRTPSSDRPGERRRRSGEGHRS